MKAIELFADMHRDAISIYRENGDFVSIFPYTTIRRPNDRMACHEESPSIAGQGAG